MKNVIISLIAVLVVVFAIDKITTIQYNRIKADETNQNYITLKERYRQLDCLTENIYYEATGENAEGKIAIAQVTINRANSSNFPNDICKVVYQKNGVVCQFSWYCDKPKALKKRNEVAYNEAREVAKAVLLEGERLSSLENAEFYHADYVNPGWKYKKLAKIGKHIFYEHP